MPLGGRVELHSNRPGGRFYLGSLMGWPDNGPPGVVCVNLNEGRTAVCDNENEVSQPAPHQPGARAEVKLATSGTNNAGEGGARLLAYARVVMETELGAFALNDVRVVDGGGKLLVCMPSRQARRHCPACTAKMGVVDRFCAQCGIYVGEDDRRPHDRDGRRVLYVDMFHPLDRKGRKTLEDVVLAEYARELKRRQGEVYLRQPSAPETPGEGSVRPR